MRDALRFLLDRVPEARPLDGGGELLERAPAPLDRPRTLSALILEGTTLRPKRIRGPASTAFGAFLDGIQRSRVALHLPGGVPVVVASVAAVIRRRRDRRLVTWDQDARRKLYLPLALVRDGARLGAELEQVVVDTSQPFGGDDGPDSRHPLALLERAVHFAQADRERLEIALAERWCADESTPLFIDGGISGSERLATSRTAVGVVKSHRRLYAENDGLAIVFGLQRGERTSVFRVESSRRTSVASWYLRLRDPAGHDPMWGLVRVEIPDGPGAPERADEVSRWILAEVTPLSLPDARWDKMVYGIRDCEEFLRAVG
ncbi:MAG TPA: hypothetical protein VMM18_08020 [Gemmatimonadaceae bacterium]|nr:hypothetical protein [Gemmatimonadaceae bacterium]